MTGKKYYLQPSDMLMNAIHDLAELQKAKTLMCDSAKGIIHLLITLYATGREYRFTVCDTTGSRSEVAIQLIGEEPEKKRLIDHEFALLDYVLVDRAKIELAYQEEWDKAVIAGRKARRETEMGEGKENGI